VISGSCWTTKLQIIAEINLQWRGRSHCLTVAYRAEGGTPCVSVLLFLLLPSLSLLCEVYWSLAVDIHCHRKIISHFLAPKFFAWLMSARIHFPGPNADQWRRLPGAAVGPIIMEGNRSIWEPVAVLPLSSIDSIYQWSNSLLKKNYCLVSRLV